MKITEIYNLYKENFLVDTDTRNIRKNSIFFALKGSNFNGNKYALEAIKKGANYAIVDEPLQEFNNNPKTILVKDVLTTLQNLAKHHRKELNIPIIALTGSNGKTTTKELINTVLSKKYITSATLGNLNNHIGVPLTLLAMDINTEIGIVEMGANHPKEIAFLSEIASPDFGYITNFGKAHLEGFGSVEGVIKAKCELYDFLIKNKKTIFVNQNDPIQLEKTLHANTISFNDEIKFIDVAPFVTLYINSTTITNSNLIGHYNYNNIAAAITIGNYFNVSTEKINEAISTYTPTNNRSQIITTKTNKIILDAYNANPSSMAVAIENFNLLKADNKIVILGDMFELGATSRTEHQEIVNLASKYTFTTILLVGEHFFNTSTSHIKFKKFDELKQYLERNQIENTTVLIKGSRGMALEKTVELIN